MGAHTIGGVNNCTGFNNINRGPYCKDNLKGTIDSGSYFDETPGTFDNNYFKVLLEAD